MLTGHVGGAVFAAGYSVDSSPITIVTHGALRSTPYAFYGVGCTYYYTGFPSNLLRHPVMGCILAIAPIVYAYARDGYYDTGACNGMYFGDGPDSVCMSGDIYVSSILESNILTSGRMHIANYYGGRVRRYNCAYPSTKCTNKIAAHPVIRSIWLMVSVCATTFDLCCAVCLRVHHCHQASTLLCTASSSATRHSLLRRHIREKVFHLFVKLGGRHPIVRVLRNQVHNHAFKRILLSQPGGCILHHRNPPNHGNSGLDDHGH